MMKLEEMKKKKKYNLARTYITRKFLQEFSFNF